jgi:hypothetical protein
VPEPERIEGREFVVEIDRERGVARVVDKVEGREYVLSPADAYGWLTDLEREKPRTHGEKVRLLEERLKRVESAPAPEEEKLEVEVRAKPPKPERAEVEVEARPPEEERLEVEVEARPEGLPPPRPVRAGMRRIREERAGEWRLEAYGRGEEPELFVLRHPRFGEYELLPEELEEVEERVRVESMRRALAPEDVAGIVEGVLEEERVRPAPPPPAPPERVERAAEELRERLVEIEEAGRAEEVPVEAAERVVPVETAGAPEEVPVEAARPPPRAVRERRVLTVPTPRGPERWEVETYRVEGRPGGVQYAFKRAPTGERVVEIRDLATGRSITVPLYAYRVAVERKLEEMAKRGLKPDPALAKASPDILRLAAVEWLKPEELKRLERAWRAPPSPLRAVEEAKRRAGAAPGRVARAVRAGFSGLLAARMPPARALRTLAALATYSSAAVAVGLLAGFVEGALVRAAEGLPDFAAPLAFLLYLLSWALSGLFSGVYLLALMATHVLVASALLVATRMARSGAEWAEYGRGRRGVSRVVDLFAWTVLSAVLALTARGVWVPLLAGFVADALFAVAVALAPVVSIALALALLLLFLLFLLAAALSRLGELGQLASKLLFLLLAGPLLPYAGFIVQLWALARAALAAWEAADAALALLLALVSLVRWVAPPLAAAAMAAVWVIFGLIASGSRDWRWFRIPLAATAALAVAGTGLDRDWAARAAVDLFRAAGEQLGSAGMVRVAGFYEWLLSLVGVRV